MSENSSDAGAANIEETGADTPPDQDDSAQQDAAERAGDQDATDGEAPDADADSTAQVQEQAPVVNDASQVSDPGNSGAIGEVSGEVTGQADKTNG